MANTEALHQLIKNKTTLIIAHRLSTIREADEIIFLNQGTIIEKGSHEDLMLRNAVMLNSVNYKKTI